MGPIGQPYGTAFSRWQAQSDPFYGQNSDSSQIPLGGGQDYIAYGGAQPVGPASDLRSAFTGSAGAPMRAPDPASFSPAPSGFAPAQRSPQTPAPNTGFIGQPRNAGQDGAYDPGSVYTAPRQTTDYSTPSPGNSPTPGSNSSSNYAANPAYTAPGQSWTGGSIWDTPGYNGYNAPSFIGQPGAPTMQTNGFQPSNDPAVFNAGTPVAGAYDQSRNLQGAYNQANIANWQQYQQWANNGFQGAAPTYGNVDTNAFNQWWGQGAGNKQGFQEPGQENFWRGNLPAYFGQNQTQTGFPAAGAYGPGTPGWNPAGGVSYGQQPGQTMSGPPGQAQGQQQQTTGNGFAPGTGLSFNNPAQAQPQGLVAPTSGGGGGGNIPSSTVTAQPQQSFNPYSIGFDPLGFTQWNYNPQQSGTSPNALMNLMALMSLGGYGQQPQSSNSQGGMYSGLGNLFSDPLSLLALLSLGGGGGQQGQRL